MFSGRNQISKEISKSPAASVCRTCDRPRRLHALPSQRVETKELVAKMVQNLNFHRIGFVPRDVEDADNDDRNKDASMMASGTKGTAGPGLTKSKFAAEAGASADEAAAETESIATTTAACLLSLPPSVVSL